MLSDLKWICATVEVLNDIRTLTLISVFSKTAKHMAKVSTLGTTERSTMESGTKVSSMVTASGEVYQETLILANGVTLKLKATEFTPGKMETDMKVSGSNVSSMAKALTYLRMETHIQVSTKTGSLMAKVNTHGEILHSTWESSAMV